MTPTPTSPTTAAHLRWPSERFYWAVLNASGLPAGERVTPERLRFLLEPDLPEPLEDVHAVFSPVGTSRGTRFVACALPRRLLDADDVRAAVTLTPDELPDCVREAVGPTFAAATLNLLLGEFEPKRVRAWRRRVMAIAAAGAFLIVGLIGLGIERRIAAHEARARELREARDDAIAAALGPAVGAQALPPELRLAAELRALRQTRRQGDQVVGAADATDALVDLLRRWPLDVPTRTESIMVSDAALHVRGSVAESDQAQHLATATADLPGWQPTFPAIQSGADGWRFALEWQRSKGTKR